MEKYCRKLVGNCWFYEVCNDVYENECIEQLFRIVFDVHIDIFGKENMLGEQCIIFKDSRENCPMLITNSIPVSIRLNVSSYTWWSQVVFQLSHEMCHYTIRQGKHNKDSFIGWFEETLCEAMSLYTLEMAELKWYFYNISNDHEWYKSYKNLLSEYLMDRYKEVEPSILHRCPSIDDLLKINDNCTVERNFRGQERNFVYMLYKKHPDEIKYIIEYSNYINTDVPLLINFEDWIKDRNESLFLKELSKIQPNF